MDFLLFTRIAYSLIFWIHKFRVLFDFLLLEQEIRVWVSGIWMSEFRLVEFEWVNLNENLS